MAEIKDAIARLRLMADVDHGDWDLSDNDRRDIRLVLDRVTALEVKCDLFAASLRKADAENEALREVEKATRKVDATLRVLTNARLINEGAISALDRMSDALARLDALRRGGGA